MQHLENDVALSKHLKDVGTTNRRESIYIHVIEIPFDVLSFFKCSPKSIKVPRDFGGNNDRDDSFYCFETGIINSDDVFRLFPIILYLFEILLDLRFFECYRLFGLRLPHFVVWNSLSCRNGCYFEIINMLQWLRVDFLLSTQRESR